MARTKQRHAFLESGMQAAEVAGVRNALAAPARAQTPQIDFTHPLFDSLPDALLVVKDRALRIQCANAAMIDLCGAPSKADLLGKTSRELFPDQVSARQDALDHQVMRTRKPATDQLERLVRRNGKPVWLMCGRWPVLDADGEVVGVASLSRVLETKRRELVFERVAAAVEYLTANLGARFEFAEMAHRARVSPGQLKRDFVSVFGQPPRQYLAAIRLEAALDRLMTGMPIVEVAHACGYPDQSSFTRRFRAATGLSPSEYRRNSFRH